MLNIYNYHTNPELFKNREKVLDSIPDFFWEKYKDNPEELKKREGAIAKSAMYSHLYAHDILKRRFEAGEKAIATNTKYSYLYARDILKGKFEAGEKAIATNAWCSYRYAADVLKERFEAGENIILAAKHMLTIKDDRTYSTTPSLLISIDIAYINYVLVPAIQNGCRKFTGDAEKYYKLCFIHAYHKDMGGLTDEDIIGEADIYDNLKSYNKTYDEMFS